MLIVFGSINLDIGVRVPRLPLPGETLIGGEARISPGGKGANQAHAARLFGAAVAMVGAVGDDDLGTSACALMQRAGVDLTSVHRLAGTTTGIATIHIADDAENCIVVAPGANALVHAGWAEDALLRRASGLLLQMEVPAVESIAVARRAKALGVEVTLNLAPALSLDGIDFTAIDTLLVNETELASAVAAAGTGGQGVAERIERLSQRWHIDVIATLGGQGVLYHGRDGLRLRQTAHAVELVDTTGAGDTFAGVFAAARAEGATTEAALRFATVAAGLACERRGAQASQPTRSEIDKALEPGNT